MRATGSHTVVLDDVFVPDGAVSLVRPADVWHPIWNVVMGAAMPLIMAVYVGVAEEAVARAVEIATKRRDSEGTAATVGRMLNHLQAAQDVVGAMVASAEDLRFDNTTEHAAAVLSRKTVTTEHLLAATTAAMEAAGGAGFSKSGGHRAVPPRHPRRDAPPAAFGEAGVVHRASRPRPGPHPNLTWTRSDPGSRSWREPGFAAGSGSVDADRLAHEPPLHPRHVHLVGVDALVE